MLKKILLALALAGRGAAVVVGDACSLLDTKAKCNACDSCDTEELYCQIGKSICEWAETPECNPVLAGGTRKLKFGASEDPDEPDDPGLPDCCITVDTCA